MDITLTSAEWVTPVSRRTLDRLNGEEGNLVAIDKIRHLLLVEDEDGAEATDNLLQQADNGDLTAHTHVGALLLQNKRPEKAIYWLQKAANRDYPEAMHLLAGCYLRGEGVPIDTDTGLMWLHAAAGAGHVIAKTQTAHLRQVFRSLPGG